jgi:uncharacterized protein (TIGR03435 family)
MMRRSILVAACLALYQASSRAQSSWTAVEFEAASVKRSDPANANAPPNVCRGGPGSADPLLFTCVNSALGAMVTTAYDLQFYELIAPDWMKFGGSLNGYDLSAKVPAGATKEQTRLMLQKLLAERFRLSVHRETRNANRYALMAGKGKPKLNAPVENAPNGRPDTMQIIGGHIHFVAERTSMKRLAGFLTTMLSGPVEDQTNLSGDFAFTLDLAPDDRWPGYSPGWASAHKDDATPDLFTALQEQLGLKLQSTRGPLEVLVVDHADKVPSEN